MYNKHKTVVDSSGQTIYKHVQEVFDILERWYRRLEDGTHVLAIPDPFDESVDIDKANLLVREIDQDFEEHENWRVIQGKCDRLPQFSRLSDSAKIAVAQEIIALLRHQKAHPEEYLD